jgi:hypothetical protein
MPPYLVCWRIQFCTNSAEARPPFGHHRVAGLQVQPRPNAPSLRTAAGWWGTTTWLGSHWANPVFDTSTNVPMAHDGTCSGNYLHMTLIIWLYIYTVITNWCFWLLVVVLSWLTPLIPHLCSKYLATFAEAKGNFWQITGQEVQMGVANR